MIYDTGDEIMLQAVGMSQYIPQLAILLAMDWLIGMFRTITNIWGDACAVSVVDHWANKCAPAVMYPNPDNPP